MPAIASLEDLKAAQKEGLSIYAMRYVYPPKPLDLRSLGVGGWRRQALCCMKMAEDRMEERMQTLASRTYSRRIEGWELINLISVLLIARSRYYAELLPQAKRSSSAALLERSDPMASLDPRAIER